MIDLLSITDFTLKNWVKANDQSSINHIFRQKTADMM